MIDKWRGSGRWTRIRSNLALAGFDDETAQDAVRDIRQFGVLAAAKPWATFAAPVLAVAYLFWTDGFIDSANLWLVVALLILIAYLLICAGAGAYRLFEAQRMKRKAPERWAIRRLAWLGAVAYVDVNTIGNQAWRDLQGVGTGARDRFGSPLQAISAEMAARRSFEPYSPRSQLSRAAVVLAACAALWSVRYI
ncbi:MAG: hypothetical protein RIA71_00810 [Oceanicaulis sp.]